MSQRSVSKRIIKLMEQLRQRIGADAPACLDQTHLAGLLTTVLLSGSPPPAGGLASLMKFIEAPAFKPRGVSLSDASSLLPALPRQGVWLVTTVCGLGALVLGYLNLAAGAAPGEKTPSAIPTALPQRDAMPPAGQASDGIPALAPHTWSFTQSDLWEELPRFGPWQWGLTNFGTTGLLAPKDEQPVVLLPPVRIPPGPFEISVVCQALRVGEAQMQPFWRDGLRLLSKTQFLPRRKGGMRGGILQKHRAIFLDRHVAHFSEVVDRTPFGLLEYERPYPGTQMALVLVNCMVTEITIRPLTREEVSVSKQSIARFLSSQDYRSYKMAEVEINTGLLLDSPFHAAPGP